MTFFGVKRVAAWIFFPAGLRVGRVSGANPRCSGVRLSRRSGLSGRWSLRYSLRLSVRVCVRVYVCARMSPRPLLTVLRWFRPQCGSDCGFESGCHGVGAGGAVRCSPVGCDLMMGQHLKLLPAAPAAASAHSRAERTLPAAPFKIKAAPFPGR